jgi:protein subunit release factor B
MLSVGAASFIRSNPSVLLHRVLRGPCRFPPARYSSFTLPEDKLSISFTTSQGPGGQNVNKVNTCVEVTKESYDGK